MDQHEKLREVAWSDLFRWLVLFRSVRIALLARVMVLGALGLVATTIGWWCIMSLFAASSDPVLVEWRGFVDEWLWDASPEFSIVTPARNAQELFSVAADGLVEAPVTVWLYMTRPFVDMFRGELTPIGFVGLLLCGVWELLVWGLFGGAITRIAALKFTRDEAPDLPAAVRHAASKIFSYSAPPLLAMAGASVFALQLVVLGWIMRLGIFTMVAGFCWPFVLLLGLMMAIILLGALVGWPLMFATVSVEGTDAFDALGSSYAYTYQRPLRLLWYVAVAGMLAAISMFVVKMFAVTAIALGNWSISWGLDEPTYREIVVSQPTTTPMLDATVIPAVEIGAATSESPIPQLPAGAPAELGRMESMAAAAIAFWKSFVGALAAGYQAGFLWVAAVGIYLLLRKDIDGAEMDEVYVEDEQDFGMPPLADDVSTGIPEIDTAANRRVSDTDSGSTDQPPDAPS